MRKIIKTSLITALLASSVVTVASASALEDAIKDTKISGKIQYRNEAKTKNKKRNLALNEWEMRVKLDTKVNDYITSTVVAGFRERKDNTFTFDSKTRGIATDGLIFAAQNVYATAKIAGATIRLGRQDIKSPFVDAKDTIKTGTGLVAIYKMGNYQVGASRYLNTNIENSKGNSVFSVTNRNNVQDINEFMAGAKFGPVSVVGFYNMTNAQDTNDTVQGRYFGKVTFKNKLVKASVGYAGGSNLGKDVNGTGSILQVNVSSKAIAGVKLSARVGLTGENDVTLDNDNDNAIAIKQWQLSTKGLKNGLIWIVGAKAKVYGGLSLGGKYGQSSGETSVKDKKIDKSEILILTDYKISKNFGLHYRYSILNTTDNSDAKVEAKTNIYQRFQMKYTF